MKKIYIQPKNRVVILTELNSLLVVSGGGEQSGLGGTGWGGNTDEREDGDEIFTDGGDARRDLWSDMW